MCIKLNKATRLYLCIFTIIIFSFNHGSALATLGDQVWEDQNANGIFDKFEPGINGVQIKLYYDTDKNGVPDGAAIATTQTSFGTTGNGYYYFKNLSPGFYLIQFILPSNYFFSPYKVPNTIPTFDSDANPNTGYTQTIEVIGNEYNTEIDAGIFKKTTVGDLIWLDTNKNGVQDINEQGLNNITVKLYSNTQQLIATTLSTNHPTSQNPGYFLFPEVAPGKYYIKLEFPSGFGYYPTIANNGNDDTDSDIDHSLGLNCSAIFEVIYKTPITNLDCGVYYNQSIGNKLWIDKNRNGIQDNDEFGLNNIQINLYNKSTNQLIQTQLTQNNSQGVPGHFLFENLLVGNYYLKVNIPNFYYITKADQGSDQYDSDITNYNGLNSTNDIILNANSNIYTIGLGLFNAYRLGNYVWDDIGSGNSYMNGIQDSNENPVANVLVYLYDTSNILIDSQYTNNLGKFEFLVDAGHYYLKFQAPTDKTFTFPNKASENLDSDVTGTFGFGTTSDLNITSNSDQPDIDAGLAPAEVLAINNLQFWSTKIDNNYIIHWALDNPEDVYKIILERNNTNQFSEIFTTENIQSLFNYKIESIISHTEYYRLKIIEKNGHITYSKILIIKPQSDLKIFQAYFTMNKLIIESKKTQENDLTITIQNSDGRLISTKQVSRIHSASPVFELDANDIPSGAYIIKIMDGNKENSIKLVK